MKKSMKYLSGLVVIVGVFALSFAISVSAFTEPGSSGSADPEFYINSSSVTQTKVGQLTVGSQVSPGVWDLFVDGPGFIQNMLAVNGSVYINSDLIVGGLGTNTGDMYVTGSFATGKGLGDTTYFGMQNDMLAHGEAGLLKPVCSTPNGTLRLCDDVVPEPEPGIFTWGALGDWSCSAGEGFFQAQAECLDEDGNTVSNQSCDLAVQPDAGEEYFSGSCTNNTDCRVFGENGATVGQGFCSISSPTPGPGSGYCTGQGGQSDGVVAGSTGQYEGQACISIPDSVCSSPSWSGNHGCQWVPVPASNATGVCSCAAPNLDAPGVSPPYAGLVWQTGQIFGDECSGEWKITGTSTSQISSGTANVDWGSLAAPGLPTVTCGENKQSCITTYGIGDTSPVNVIISSSLWNADINLVNTDTPPCF